MALLPRLMPTFQSTFAILSSQAKSSALTPYGITCQGAHWCFRSCGFTYGERTDACSGQVSNSRPQLTPAHLLSPVLEWQSATSSPSHLLLRAGQAGLSHP